MPLRRGIHPSHLHPRHQAEARRSSGNHGQLHGAGHVSTKEQKIQGRKAKLPVLCFLNLSAHFYVWVTVWVRQLTHILTHTVSVEKARKTPEIHVTGITGSTGAGQKPSETTHFSWREGNLSAYKSFTHQHLGEVNETLSRLAPHYKGQMNFVPVRGCHTRGIMASVYFLT